MSIYIIDAGLLGVWGAYATLKLAQLWLEEEAGRRCYTVEWHDSKLSATVDNALCTDATIATICMLPIVTLAP